MSLLLATLAACGFVGFALPKRRNLIVGLCAIALATAIWVTWV